MKTESQGQWKWISDGSNVDAGYTHWKPGVNLNDQYKNCAAIWVQELNNDNFGNWEPYECSNTNFFICAVI